MSSNYRKATNWLCDEIESDIVDGKIDYEAQSFAEVFFKCTSGFEMNFGENTQSLSIASLLSKLLSNNPASNTLTYEITEDVACELLEFASADPEVFDLCCSICAQNINAEAWLPPSLRMFVSKSLLGNIIRPKLSHRPRNKNWGEKCYLYGLAISVRADFGLKFTRNPDGNQKLSACDAVAEALSVCGRPTRYSEIKNICVHPDNQKFRMEHKLFIKAFAYSSENNLEDEKVFGGSDYKKINKIVRARPLYQEVVVDKS